MCWLTIARPLQRPGSTSTCCRRHGGYCTIVHTLYRSSYLPALLAHVGLASAGRTVRLLGIHCPCLLRTRQTQRSGFQTWPRETLHAEQEEKTCTSWAACLLWFSLLRTHRAGTENSSALAAETADRAASVVAVAYAASDTAVASVLQPVMRLQSRECQRRGTQPAAAAAASASAEPDFR
jgi:hypothetical protein